jgi:hypothetical protein
MGARRKAEPADELQENRWHLIRQDENFCFALTTAIKHGRETAAGVTATVRTGTRRTLPKLGHDRGS